MPLADDADAIRRGVAKLRCRKCRGVGYIPNNGIGPDWLPCHECNHQAPITVPKAKTRPVLKQRKPSKDGHWIRRSPS